MAAGNNAGSSNRGQRGPRYKSPVYRKLFLSPEEANWTKDELVFVLFWFKWFTSIAIGLTWGVLNMQGLQAFLAYVAIVILSSLSLYRSWLQVDEVEFGGHSHLLMEGMPMANGAFMLCWILTYTNLHVSPPVVA